MRNADREEKENGRKTQCSLLLNVILVVQNCAGD